MAEKVKNEKKEGSKGNILKIIIIILLIAVLIAAGTAAGYVFATKIKAGQNTTDTNKAAVVNIKTFSLDEFLVNLKDDNATGYLKAKIYIGYDGDNKDYKNLPTELEDNKAILRDAVNSILRNKKPSDFNEAGVEQIKKEIKDKINPLLNDGKIESVYFYDIIVQAQ